MWRPASGDKRYYWDAPISFWPHAANTTAYHSVSVSVAEHLVPSGASTLISFLISLCNKKCIQFHDMTIGKRMTNICAWSFVHYHATLFCLPVCKNQRNILKLMICITPMCPQQSSPSEFKTVLRAASVLSDMSISLQKPHYVGSTCRVHLSWILTLPLCGLSSYPENGVVPLHSKDVRPRARTVYQWHQLEVGMVVMVNFNPDEPKERGYWYDAQIQRKRETRTLHEIYTKILLG